MFLVGLQKVGKGDWRAISRNYVKTRTPTQVASHAQKYFLCRSNLNRCHCRSSLFDITTDTDRSRIKIVFHSYSHCALQPLKLENSMDFLLCQYMSWVLMRVTPMEELTLGQKAMDLCDCDFIWRSAATIYAVVISCSDSNPYLEYRVRQVGCNIKLCRKSNIATFDKHIAANCTIPGEAIG